MSEDLANHVRHVIDANSYMVLGTADRAGHPWVTPVWFASEDYFSFHWVSSPEAKHSRNLADRPEIAITIFDSSVTVGGAEAAYMKGVATELTADELTKGLELFDRATRHQIGSGWSLEEVTEPSLFRLYRATVSEHWVLIRGSDLQRGSGVDRSERVALD